jgi:hypothetical protein
MKQLIAFTPTFTPGVAGTGTLDFSAYPGFSLDKLYAVINVTRNSPVFIPGTPQYGYSGTPSGSVIQLSADTSTHQPTDVLSIFYETTNGGLDNNLALENNGRLQQISELSAHILTELRVMNIILMQGLTMNLNEDTIQSLRDDINNTGNFFTTPQ